MDFLEGPVRVVGVEDGNDEAALVFAADEVAEAQAGEPCVDGFEYARVPRPLGGFAFDEILAEGLEGGVDGLDGRREAHFAGLLEAVVLHEEVAVVGADGEGGGLEDLVHAAHDE